MWYPVEVRGLLDTSKVFAVEKSYKIYKEVDDLSRTHLKYLSQIANYKFVNNGNP